MTRTTRRCASGIVDHTPQYAEVDRHHVYPLYLSDLLGVPDRIERVDLCSGCHDLAHHVLHHLISGGEWGGHRLSSGLKAVVSEAWAWYQAEVQR